jgi:trans-aconitate methyltransferase
MSEARFLDYFINKSVDFKYQRQGVRFHLTQSLFSSHDVDDGTRLLLKTIAQKVDFEHVNNLLDIGCGVGVIGICLGKRHPHLKVTFQDRDALAIDFTALNSQLNRLGPTTTKGSLALQDIGNRQFDLIVSNLPGKAGPAALKDIVTRIPGHLSEGGLAAVVVVKPLAELVERALQENGCDILFVEKRKDHAVFHYMGGRPVEEPVNSLKAYLRGTNQFEAAGLSFKQTTAHDLPEFDTLGYYTSLAINTIKNQQVSGRVLAWNPGQGHLPVFLALGKENHISEMVIAGRDLLSLRVSELNLEEHGGSEGTVTLSHLPHIMALENVFDFAVVFPDADPGVPWDKFLLKKCHNLLLPGGKVLVTARSTFMHRVLSAKSGLAVKSSKKRHGFRAVLLEKR